MDTLQIIVLAIVQGLTEFLPISSSAHLILVPLFTDWADQGMAFDVAVHVGSLSAVLWYFRADLKSLFSQWFISIRTGQRSDESRLVWGVAFGTLPVVIVGLLFSDFVSKELRTPVVIAWATLGFGLLLAYADFTGKRSRDEYSLSMRDILIIGIAQALAVIPGTSRSGITITAALLLNLKPQAAARFSFLLSIPVIILAGGHDAMKLFQQNTAVDWGGLSLGAVLAGISAYLCINLFIRLLDRIGMMPFVIYRLVLGSILLLWFV
jgi:undecaprenyl-diphosphatase